MSQPRRHRRRNSADVELAYEGLPDTSTPEFAAEARRQSRMVARSPRAEEDQAFVDAISDWPD